LNQARATARQAVANAELAQATLTRWQELVAKKVVSAQEFDEKKSALDARQADLTAAKANVVRLEKLQGFQKVVAPFSGIVTARNIDNGALVSAGKLRRSFTSRRPTRSESTSPSRKQTRVRLLPDKAPLSHSVKSRRKVSTRKSSALPARSIPHHARS
jgi:multidrug efflux pump subunit AcrA (membrane-fusion protein)